MPRHFIHSLADCSEFRQTLIRQPPAIVHATALTLIFLLAISIAWCAMTKVNLVVRATGRVRPLNTTSKIYASPNHVNRRVIEVNVKEGSIVRKGDVLIRLDSRELVERIQKNCSSLLAIKVELENLQKLSALNANHFRVAKSKADAELRQAILELQRARENQTFEIQEREAELYGAQDRLQRNTKLLEKGSVTAADMVHSESEVKRITAQLNRAKVPPNQEHIESLRRAAELVEKEFDVKRNELATKLVARQADADGIQNEIEILNLDLRQTVLASPIDGVVIAGEINVGDVLVTGVPALEIAASQELCFEAIVSTGEVAEVRPGMPVKIRFDAYDYQTYGALDGNVQFISPDSKESGSQHEGKLNAYLVKLQMDRPHVGHGNHVGRIKLGLTGNVEMITGQESILTVLIKRMRRSISLG